MGALGDVRPTSRFAPRLNPFDPLETVFVSPSDARLHQLIPRPPSCGSPFRRRADVSSPSPSQRGTPRSAVPRWTQSSGATRSSYTGQLVRRFYRSGAGAASRKWSPRASSGSITSRKVEGRSHSVQRHEHHAGVRLRPEERRLAGSRAPWLSLGGRVRGRWWQAYAVIA